MNKIKALRQELEKNKVDGMIIPMCDPFQNDFVPEYYHRIKFLSGFTGSLGTIIVLKDKAAIFVDGRYTLQAEQQIDSTLFDIRPYGIYSMIQWVLEKTNKAEEIHLGYDPWDYTVFQINQLTKSEEAIRFSPLLENPVDSIWKNHPPIVKTNIFLYPPKYTDLSWEEKLDRVCYEIRKHKLDAIFLSSAASICWLLNIRGNDVPHTPIALCYALIHRTGKVDLFASLDNLTPKIKKNFSSQVSFHEIMSTNLEKTVPSLARGLRVGYTEQDTPIRIKQILDPTVSLLKNVEDPCSLLRACKTKNEISHIKKAHVWDGVALVKFFHWLHKNVPSSKITEFDASLKIDSLRAENKNFRGTSFPTIGGANENGSFVHYRAEKKSKTLQVGDLFLCDSGGQYFEGTTDVTRTVSFGGMPTPKQKDCFTRVLKGFIALFSTQFPMGTTGSQLDALARQFLWQIGLDYAHSTGHGVGQYLNVHEGPQIISSRSSSTPLQPGMVVSNEPGCYLPGEFGIRIENLMFVEEADQKDILGRRLLKFKTLTLCPIDQSCIDFSSLAPKEIEWLNDYHQTVWQSLNRFLDAEEKEWLKKATEPFLSYSFSHQDSMRESITGSTSG